ncbi:host attachment protein [Aminobacter sp. BA135]|uniref:host attachment protein n=1 Tax=Aminobacter sp. BA135 TaxID=537596 RepID=UPI003D7AE9BF
MKSKKTWILVADGARARIIQQIDGDNKEDQGLPEELVFELAHKQMREIMSDKPGRSFSSLGRRRSAMDYASNPEREQEVQFARMLMDELEGHYADHEFDHLVLVAERRMLGALRRSLPRGLLPALVKEVAKDLTKLPKLQLMEAVSKLHSNRVG